MAEKTNKFLVAWAHFPVFVGFLVPIIVWIMSKDKDPEAAFQAKQALGWQFGGGIALTIIMVGGGIIATILASIDPTLGLIGLLIFPVMGLLLLAYTIYAVLGAWNAIQEKPFVYPIIGKMLKK